MSKKRRSVVWVVSTHVLTTGLAIPAVAGVASGAVVSAANIRDPLVTLYVQCTFAVLGYAGGTLYSLGYLRKTTECDSWTKCTKPSIITFLILNILGCAWSVYELKQPSALQIGILVISYVVGAVAAATLTSAGFARMPPGSIAAENALQSNASGAPNNPRKGNSRRRLVAAGVGLAVGCAVGIGVAIYMDRGGWQPPGGWSTRLLTGLVVGGIGAVLGLVSGPPKI